MKEFNTGALALGMLLLAGGCAMRTTSQNNTAPSGPIQATTVQPGVIPAGTTLAIRTNEAIDSTQQKPTYAAQLEQDVMDQSGNLLAPKGSAAQLAINQTTQGGVGTPTMDLALKSITVSGRTYAINSANQQEGEQGLGTNKRTAEMVGGGAVLGTLLGAAIGGGKGAAVGAAVGAAGGATTQVLTRGDKVSVPAETVLTFKLDQPWRLEGY
jgi:hypothetical protein